jgi:bifunctional non-homologous end joining protein LigD
VKAAELLRFGLALVVGWTDPEGSRPWRGALLLAYCSRSWSACGRRHWQDADRGAAPRSSQFGLSLVLSRMHWVRPQLVAEVKYLTRTEDNLLRQAVYQGLRGDKPAAEVRRSPPHV